MFTIVTEKKMKFELNITTKESYVYYLSQLLNTDNKCISFVLKRPDKELTTHAFNIMLSPLPPWFPKSDAFQDDIFTGGIEQE